MSLPQSFAADSSGSRDVDQQHDESDSWSEEEASSAEE